ncbi:MAG: hypothetical protein L0H55_13930 [Candidatus Nitrosocosmicus sp.]|nr:hypothetical protein [Candidatus Nitrosocosmicus sp.]
MSARFNTDAHTNDRSDPKSLKMFDWIKAAKIIKENNIQNASIGLGVTIDDAILILQNGKPIKITGNMFLSFDSTPVLINNDSGEIMDCFFSINEQDVEYSHPYNPSSTDITKLSGWPKVALNIIKEAFYYKSIRENKFSQVYLICLLFYFWKILECSCFGL